MSEISDADTRYLRRAFQLARDARDAGNNPFGCLLVAPDGTVLYEQLNEGLVPAPVRTNHAETELARRASREHTPNELALCTLYTSAEPCAMCAGTIYWAGIGRIVFGMTEHELKGITGAHPDNPTLDLPCRQVFASGQLDIDVVGPALADEARVVHEDFWNRPRVVDR